HARHVQEEGRKGDHGDGAERAQAAGRVAVNAPPPTDPIREEAQRLIAAALAAAAAAASQTGGGRFANGSAECCVCPICRVIAAMREPDPDLAGRLAAGAGDLAV